MEEKQMSYDITDAKEDIQTLAAQNDFLYKVCQALDKFVIDAGNDSVFEGVKQKIKCDEVKCVNKAFFMKKTACTLIKRITSKQVTSNCYADLKKCDAAIDAEFTEQCPKTIFPHISDEPLATCHCAYATEPSSPCTASGKPWTIFKESGVQRTIEELDYCYDDGFDCLEALREQKCSRCKFDYASCI